MIRTFTDLSKNTTEDLLRVALTQLTNHEIQLGDIPPVESLVEIRDILEELRSRRTSLILRRKQTR